MVVDKIKISEKTSSNNFKNFINKISFYKINKTIKILLALALLRTVLKNRNSYLCVM